MTKHSISAIPERGRQEREISAQSELERLAELLRENQKLISLGRLAAAIAHEINNPLESITNLLYLMEVDRDSPEKLEEYLRLAQRELGRVVQISKQTLSFSRETGAPVRGHLHELLDEVLLLYARRIKEKNIQVVRQYESHDAVMVFPGEMRQVLSNLIVNAIEAMETNGVLRLRLRASRMWQSGGLRGIRLSIGDSGPGIPFEVRSRLGEPFFTTKGQSGTGLGLWVTRSILSRYGGTLQLRSSTLDQNHGTVFSMLLPISPRPLEVISGGAGTGRVRNAEFFPNENFRAG